MKRLSVLGSTGSIGRSTLDVVESHPGAFRVVALGGGRSLDLLEAQARRFRPDLVAAGDADMGAELARRLGPGTRVLHGVAGLEEVARHPEADLVVSALVGSLGMLPTYAAVLAGRTVALANKEALVAGGAFLTRKAQETGAVLLPVDSEHNALHQCLRGEDRSEVRRLWLTASGGPFRTRPAATLATVTAEEALRHPTWSMGRKITIDSATLMNKGLELIEAHHLFGTSYDRIDIVVHPQSIIHSLIQLCDGATLAHLGYPDMRVPISYSLHYPERVDVPVRPLDLVELGSLTFEPVDEETFRCVRIARDAARAGGTATCTMNAANEIAVHAFLGGRLRFLDIADVIEETLSELPSRPVHSFEALGEADAEARRLAGELVSERAPA